MLGIIHHNTILTTIRIGSISNYASPLCSEDSSPNGFRIIQTFGIDVRLFEAAETRDAEFPVGASHLKTRPEALSKLGAL